MVGAKNALIDQLSISLTNFLMIVLLARTLENEAVAKYSFAYSMFLLVFMIANALIYQHVLALKNDDLDDTVINKYRSLNFLLTLASFPFLYLGYLFLASDAGETFQLEVMLILFYILINQTADFERRILYYYNKLSFMKPAYISLFILFMRIALFFFMEPSSFFSFLILMIIPGIPIMLYSLYKIKVNIIFDNFSYFFWKQFRDGKWLIVNIPVNWGWGQAPLYLTTLLLNLHSAGIFMAIRSVTNVGNIAMELIPTYFGARISKLFHENRQFYIKYIFKLLIGGSIIWLCCFFMLLALGDLILEYVLGIKYIKYNELFLLFWIFSLLLFYSRVLSIHIRLVSMTHILPYSYFAATVVMIGMALLPIIGMNMNGLAYSMIFGVIALLGIQIMPFIKYKKINYD